MNEYIRYTRALGWAVSFAILLVCYLAPLFPVVINTHITY